MSARIFESSRRAFFLSVPQVMSDLRILSLEIQRMPKSIHDNFANPAWYPYLSVCTTSTHDMNPIRAWWEEDR
ncbi:MAG: 4-alpha-glucanotransferase, partial [Clostridia bacterium]|nr:4-alpha-glucanotransferase [Clostridia bacterium]